MAAQPHHPLAFTGFYLNPQNVGFQNQEQGEKVILLLRQHLVTQIFPLFFILIMIILPFLTIWVINSVVTLSNFINLTASEMFFALAVWYLIIFGLTFERFLLWYFNVYLVTSERIIDVDFFGIAFKRISECRLAQIQDVTSASSGPVETFFDYGNVYIQTAAENPEFEFHSVPLADEVVRQIGIQVRLEEAEPAGVVA
jgi:membrane protein YdbS with pleckstrin-like domain